MRLNIREFTSKKPRNPFNCKAFDNIYELAAAVIAPSRQPFGILIRQDRALCFQHRFADDVFGGNELDLIALPAKLAGDRLRNVGIRFGKGCRKQPLLVHASRKRVAHRLWRWVIRSAAADSTGRPKRQAGRSQRPQFR